MLERLAKIKLQILLLIFFLILAIFCVVSVAFAAQSANISVPIKINYTPPTTGDDETGDTAFSNGETLTGSSYEYSLGRSVTAFSVSTPEGITIPEGSEGTYTILNIEDKIKLILVINSDGTASMYLEYTEGTFVDDENYDVPNISWDGDAYGTVISYVVEMTNKRTGTITIEISSGGDVYRYTCEFYLNRVISSDGTTFSWDLGNIIESGQYAVLIMY